MLGIKQKPKPTPTELLSLFLIPLCLLDLGSLSHLYSIHPVFKPEALSVFDVEQYTYLITKTTRLYFKVGFKFVHLYCHYPILGYHRLWPRRISCLVSIPSISPQSPVSPCFIILHHEARIIFQKLKSASVNIFIKIFQ